MLNRTDFKIDKMLVAEVNLVGVHSFSVSWYSESYHSEAVYPNIRDQLKSGNFALKLVF